MAQIAESDGLLLQAIEADDATLRRLAYADPEAFPVLLDSAARGPLSRYSVLAAYPQATLWQDGRRQLHASPGPAPTADGFLAALDGWWRAERRARGDEIAATSSERSPGPFRGGWVVFLGYELAAEVEPLLDLAVPEQPDASAPAAFALRIACGIAYDHVRRESWLFAEAGRDDLLEGLQQAVAQLPEPEHHGLTRLAVSEESARRYRVRVEAALEYIRAGDIYQANLSRPWRASVPRQEPLQSVGAALYERLRAVNPAPFAGLAQFRQWRLLSSSPERLVRVAGGHVDTRPIAGTRPRSGAPGDHEHEIAALIAHPKERAEHVMLIDLERNDLGRICRPGSVRADQFMHIESYPHVHHIVSNVGGELLPQVTPVDVLRAVFPGGTITGCPKFRCMQIIAELEAEARQAYTGGLGYINLDGSMDFNILIRSLTLQPGALEFRTGAGIVADSDWRRELAETRAKARGLLAAVSGA
ncbi:MAG TPA: aminodeoxychorismate synthase component I [Steroidobacteraceae bacterium]|jgi:anthranilate synthase component 1